MKKIRNLLLGLVVLILATSTNISNGSTPAHATKHAVKVNKKKPDSYFLFFEMYATPATGGGYAVVLNYVLYDATLGFAVSATASTNIGITITSGPYSGASFTFPSGASSMSLGTFPTSPAGYDFDMTSSPTSQGPYHISQNLIGGTIIER